jgi:radical SAM protein with 4Fe4S-binding SPASM domain
MRELYSFIPQNMSMATYFKTLEQLKEFPQRIKLLSLTGQGEPLLNKNLSEMVRLAKQADAANRIEIISNAALLTPEVSDALIEAGLDGLRISLQGMSSERYLQMCGVTIDYDAFISNIQYFYEHKRTCDLFVKIMDTSLSKGEESIFYSTFDNVSDRMYIERCKPAYYNVPFTKDMESKSMDRFGNSHSHRLVCPLCFFQLAIFPDGEVMPCCSIYKPASLGNVHETTLKRIFSGDKLRAFQIIQLKGKRMKHPKCSRCIAPDDVSQNSDVLDQAAEEILAKLEGRA